MNRYIILGIFFLGGRGIGGRLREMEERVVVCVYSLFLS
jgi:hypothetical protein